MFEETKYYLQWDNLGRYVSKDKMTDILYVNCFFFNSLLLFPKKMFEKAVMGSVFVSFSFSSPRLLVSNWSTSGIGWLVKYFFLYRGETRTNDLESSATLNLDPGRGDGGDG